MAFPAKESASGSPSPERISVSPSKRFSRKAVMTRPISNRPFRYKDTASITTHPRVFGHRGAVAAEHYLASMAGIDILKQGGTAIDAAIAATLVEGVVNAHMHTIGGE